MSKKEKIAARLILWLVLFLLPDSEDKNELKKIATSIHVSNLDT